MRMIQQMISWLPQLLNGAKITILLTLCAVSMGLLLSIFLALGKMSKNRILSGICSVYIFFFRGTPLLMQLYFIYFGLPQINMALTINSRFFAAFLAFSLNSAAYCSEFIRAAIQSIDRGQFEASKALGLSKAQTMQLVIFPQSIRRLVPSVANEFIQGCVTGVHYCACRPDQSNQSDFILHRHGYGLYSCNDYLSGYDRIL